MSAFDTRTELRENAHEICGFVRLEAENAQNYYCEKGDDVSRSYSMRSLVAYVRAAAQTCQQLRTERERLLTPSREAGE